MSFQMRQRLRLGRYGEGLDIVEVGVTPLNVDGVPPDYRELLIEAQRRQHKQINEISKAIAEYDTKAGKYPVVDGESSKA
jgi:hypothetical protein